MLANRPASHQAQMHVVLHVGVNLTEIDHSQHLCSIDPQIMTGAAMAADEVEEWEELDMLVDSGASVTVISDAMVNGSAAAYPVWHLRQDLGSRTKGGTTRIARTNGGTMGIAE